MDKAVRNVARSGPRTIQVADHKRDKDDLRARRRMVNTLTREGGMIASDAMSGDIVEVLADGGLFRLRDVLIGTVAFQCYSRLLGVRLPLPAVSEVSWSVHEL